MLTSAKVCRNGRGGDVVYKRNYCIRRCNNAAAQTISLEPSVSLRDRENPLAAKQKEL